MSRPTALVFFLVLLPHATVQQPAMESSRAWSTWEVLVRVTGPLDLPAIAARYDTFATPSSVPRLGSVTVPAGHHPASFAALLAEDPSVTEARPMGLARATGLLDGLLGDLAADATAGAPDAWHLDAAGVSPGRADGVIVAILDSGVAYRGAPAVPTTLRDVDIVAPRDLTTGLREAFDGHQHGTHIASLGLDVAPCVTLMPVRILDADNVGTELDLIEGLWHVARHGADVVYLSVAFHPDYTPSLALVQALDAAAEVALLVGASGNDGADHVAWPAASPSVMAVGATRPTSRGELEVAPYSNSGAGVDLLAPGGDPTRDADLDTWPDGLVAETIHLGDPTRLGAFVLAGTSQATAVTSGAAARLIAAGARRSEVRARLQTSLSGGAADTPRLDLDQSLDDLESSPVRPDRGRVLVATAP